MKQNAIATPAPTRDGDALIKSHEKRIRLLSLRFLRPGGPQISDLVQEGRIALWNASRRWREDGGASLWTYARRDVFAAMLRCAQAHFDDAHEPLDDCAVEDDVELEVQMLVRECLAMLSPLERDVIRRFLEGETFEAIGGELGMSDRGVRRIFDGAVATLRERAS